MIAEHHQWGGFATCASRSCVDANGLSWPDARVLLLGAQVPGRPKHRRAMCSPLLRREWRRQPLIEVRREVVRATAKPIATSARPMAVAAASDRGPIVPPV